MSYTKFQVFFPLLSLQPLSAEYSWGWEPLFEGGEMPFWKLCCQAGVCPEIFLF
jgi:hypothetical protein